MFITPSSALKKRILNVNHNIDSNRIQVIPNFLTDDWTNIKPNYDNKKYFLYVGRLEKNKGAISIIRAANQLPKDIEFHIVGTGSQEKYLKKYAEQNNLYNIKFLGHMEGQTLKNEYHNCIATIVPSCCFEVFGLVNVESLRNGKPVIASNVGGIPEIIEHNKTGLLFEPDDIEQLKQNILTYWNNQDLAIEHGKNGYEQAKNNYTEEKYHEQIMKVYEQVINEYKGA